MRERDRAVRLPGRREQRPKFDLSRSLNQMLGYRDAYDDTTGLTVRYTRAMSAPAYSLDVGQIEMLLGQGPTDDERSLIVPIAVERRAVAEPMETLIADTLAATHRLQAAVALGQRVDQHVGPVLALQLDAEAKALLRQVHDVSDRVITIDRHLGVDFFDTPSAGEDAGYLLDFAPEFLLEERQRIVLAGEVAEPVELRQFVRADVAAADEQAVPLSVAVERLRDLQRSGHHAHESWRIEASPNSAHRSGSAMSGRRWTVPCASAQAA